MFPSKKSSLAIIKTESPAKYIAHDRDNNSFECQKTHYQLIHKCIFINTKDIDEELIEIIVQSISVMILWMYVTYICYLHR